MEKEMPVGELVATLIHGTMVEMLEAAEAIGREGAPAVDFISPLLHSPDCDTRWRAAIACERIGGPAVEALIAAASLDSTAICTPAIWALEHIADARAIGTLISVLNSGTEHCRWMAAAALLRIGGEHEWAVVEEAFTDDPWGRSIVDELLLGS
jgi:HEAT repeat protein